MEKLIYIGSESKTYLTKYIGKLAIKKVRFSKKYRIKEINEKLIKKRTKNEGKILKDLIGKINVPMVFDVYENTLLIEYVEGKKMKEIDLKSFDFKKLGEIIREIHEMNIIHGDLTPSNILIKDGEIYLIDFGLSYRSQRIEDKATDLLLLKKLIKAEFPEIFEEAWIKLTDGYNNEKVIEHISKIEKRARYL